MSGLRAWQGPYGHDRETDWMIDQEHLPQTGARALALGGWRMQRLFETLLHAEGRLVTRDALVEALWGRDRPRDVSASLAGYVAVLRNRLEPGVHEAQSVIVGEDGGYRFTLADRAVRAG